MAEKLVEAQKSEGGYMSVDAAAAVQHNQPIIDKIREAFQQAQPPATTPQVPPPLPAQSRK